ncbi:uncharacterized protein MELLADRAFT_113538 [Melampsora larici-populina 98AG31]|uniref:Uncharacterized protein n=1 Tax=Melampsora larici-populina (strain 98AG31 / pathotype 3-4-7) TaxID=747676 RepID=F4SA82_MELLP|nr:uncharacterized protein MELLADRAFT_113538 [Melampsora larici-populina 98AG31]EGF98450.1 hypothetical protein MELLADRAFT_113538 [Melampsora larici-populina 98AG31]
MWHGPNHRICTCVQLGCDKQFFKKNGQITPGRLFHRTNYPNHLEAANRAGVPVPHTTSNNILQATLPHPSGQLTSTSQSPPHPPQPRVQPAKRPRDDYESELVHADMDPDTSRPPKNPRVSPPLSDIIPSSSTAIIQPSISSFNTTITTAGSARPLLIFPTEPFYIPRRMLQHTSCIQSMYHVIHDYINHNRSNKSCRTMLEMERFKLKTTFTASNPMELDVLTEIPSTIEKALRCFHLEVHVHELLCCRIGEVGKSLQGEDDARLQKGDYSHIYEPPLVDEENLGSTTSSKHIVGKTMIQRHTLKTLFNNLCDNTPPEYAQKIGFDALTRTSGAKWQPTTLSTEIIGAIQPLLNNLGLSALPKFEKTSIWRNAGKTFSTLQWHVGNSRVEFQDRAGTSFGEIIHIIRIKTYHNPIFVVRPFTALTPGDELKSPYSSYPYLKARVMYRQTQPLRGLAHSDLFGHAALVENSAGVLEITQPTIFVLSLRSLGIIDMASTFSDRASPDNPSSDDMDTS